MMPKCGKYEMLLRIKRNLKFFSQLLKEARHPPGRVPIQFSPFFHLSLATVDFKGRERFFRFKNDPTPGTSSKEIEYIFDEKL
jgi:hypothetical protein